VQKRAVQLCRENAKPVIVATQMLDSMIENSRPTRAEASDVANAVLDGTDAVMLSAESASGRYPVETIEAMARICVEVEQTQPLNLEQDFLNRVFQRVDQSIAMAALFTAFHLKVKAIASLTESGSTALWMSRLNCGVPIYALTAQTSTRYKCALFRDVFPLMVKFVGHDREELLREAEKVLVENNVVKAGDLIVLTIGEPIGKAGGTNTMKIVKVGEHLKG
jgi:pyruvate kinase